MGNWPYQKSKIRGGRGGGGGTAEREKGFCRKVGDPVSLGIFSTWGVVNVPTFNYTLIIVFLFPLLVGVTPFPLYSFCSCLQVYTYWFHNTVVSSSYRLQIPCLHHAGVSSMSAHIQFNLWSVYYVFIWWDLMSTSSWEKLHPVPTAMLIVSNWYYQDTFKDTQFL